MVMLVAEEEFFLSVLGFSAAIMHEHCGTSNLDRQRQIISPLGGIDDKIWDLSREAVGDVDWSVFNHIVLPDGHFRVRQRTRNETGQDQLGVWGNDGGQ